jgi:hypothetical protein
MVEPQENLESVQAQSGLGKDLEEACRRYTDDQHKIVCLESTRNGLSLVMQGLNEEAKREAFTATSELKTAKKQVMEDTEKPEKIPTPELGEVTVYDKDQVKK